MAAIDDLLQKVSDPVLRERLTKEIQKLKNKKGFGLVFEEHMPECTPLYEIPVTKGSRVAPRDKEIKETFTVASVDGDTAHCVSNTDKSEHDFCVKDIVVTAEIGEAIYPYLKEIDRVCNAPENDTWHTLIEADNYHALQLLKYMYAGKVDCIYIDPPYNKEDSKDWKYNCNYVDGNDMYRHSKWLSMMERRLKLAKNLLNPKDSVLIVTIDEQEYLHCGCLLEQLFPEAQMQMITSRINKKGSTRAGQFARCDEYIYLLQFGKMRIQKNKYSMLDVTDNSNPDAKDTKQDTIWNSMLRRGASGSSRQESPTMFYPVWINEKTKRIICVGEPLRLTESRFDVEKHPPIDGLRAVWPIRTDNSEGRWQLGYETLRDYVAQGIAKLGAYNKARDQWAILFLKKKQKEQLADGVIVSEGMGEDGALILRWNEDAVLDREPKTMWVRDWHDASTYGTNLLSKIIPNREFPFPKSLYAVEDVIRFYTLNKKNALILDFFAGSGTTLHAVNLLNAKDGGRRRCIMVTNNEIGEKTEKKMRKAGYRPGDKEWEDIGIARYATWPRTVCSIEGHDVNGKPLKGNYLGLDTPMSDGFKANAIYFKLGFLDKNAVALGRQFKELLGVLWMKAGCIGPCPQTHEGDEIPDMMILPQNKMAVLIDETSFASFAKEMENHPEIETVYIITDSERGYREMIHVLDVKNTYRLYRDYLENFRINLKG